ncbi:hypothetical protein LSH36_687g02036 [Paralvinella palmiformis]|uniref:C-type lectin domain-containing protein n=1 Tax=Paralvinella palmiformis TaxID=53620 RepID=A0AAD9J2W9_9ANNE|nr:hypothetical protein LSH36_687g02036 [Paralvinella palmiformis]
MLDKQSYNEARRKCSLSGGRLAVIRDPDINHFLGQITDPEQSPELYIGLTDQITEGSFIWDDGTPLGAFSNWADNGKGGYHSPTRDCVLYDVITGSWLTHNCNDRKPYVCENGDFVSGN